jgi:hypothetical protein
MAGVGDEKLQRSSRMADPQDRPDDAADFTPEHAPGAGPTPPAPPAPTGDTAPAKPPEQPAEMSTPPAKAPDKPAKKTPAKKAPAKAAKKAAKKSPAKKAPAKKAAKKAHGKKAEPAAAKPLIQPPTPPRIETNGQLAAAAKDAAAHAKSTVDAARNPVSGEAGLSSAGRSPVPLAVAIAISLLALLLVRQLRQRGASRDD